MENKYAIIDIYNKDYFKDLEGNISLYDTYDEAIIDCGLYEFEDVWIIQFIKNYKDQE